VLDEHEQQRRSPESVEPDQPGAPGSA
jgi:hypothetical protein